MRDIFKRRIALPQDHGAWVFIISPLSIGIFAGNVFRTASLFLILAAMAVFLMRQPMTVLVKIQSGRRPRVEFCPALFWVISYGVIALLAVAGLIRGGYDYLLFLALPGLPVFLWYLWLVSRRSERKQIGVEIISTGVLSLAASAAFWIGKGGYDPLGWWLWILIWMQSAASIVYAYLRLDQRSLDANDKRREDGWRMGRRVFYFTSLNLCGSLILGWIRLIPALIFIPYLIQWSETLWGIAHPAIGWKPTRIGIRQLIISAIWTFMFITCWRDSWMI